MTEANSIEFRISEVHDNGNRREIGHRWEGTLDIVADGNVVYSEVFWEADEFAIDLVSWLDGSDEEYVYVSIENPEPVLWVRHMDGRWILGSDLNEEAVPKAIVGLASGEVFRRAAREYWQDAVRRFPGLAETYRSMVARRQSQLDR